MEIIYDKLVRDNIPEIIKSNNGEPYFRKLNDDEYWEYLLKKDNEELEEVRTASSIEERKQEFADKLELIRAMAEFNGFTLQDIIDEADRKKRKTWWFSKKTFIGKSD